MHVIYGGTFDPVHHGHLRLSLELKDYLAVAQVHLVPSYTPPHRGATGASADQRLRLLQLAIAGEPALAIDSRELDRGGKSFTADTLRQLRAELGPDCPLVMAVGTDAFAGFDRWRQWQEILALAHIVVVSRPGPVLDPQGVPAFLLSKHCVEHGDELKSSPCGRIVMFAPPLLDISATAIRQRLAEGHSARYLLPWQALAEIHRQGLYGACPAVEL
ncbi:nicotinate-nucleotide adenylyltransferase [Marinobacter psychrophilus]|jgi:nicotinate-nucleotide adenylyltransferase|uniref:nicotinate-nucleotide adenylyltransferase n=1 Tax=Marinobacter psychrophilus TaxID=330734 RepID=UPI001B762B00|nr:nicotinate-nucleotide adenylyltransferase [Marinobacter psychrophilus]MBQ0762994.1 nicotinate-nucleotide adenylyltransferase [Marinobacter psychrophilus]MBQ0846068.1 nicotinate-nucleotide adenylyltransferase [Marinobacter psychrophilus]